MNKLLAALFAALFATVAFAHDAVLLPVPSGVRLGLRDRDTSLTRLHPRHESFAGSRRYERDAHRWDRDESFARVLRVGHARYVPPQRRRERFASR